MFPEFSVKLRSNRVFEQITQAKFLPAPNFLASYSAMSTSSSLSAAKMEDLEKDLAELRRFLDQCGRISVKNLLSAEIRRVEDALSIKRAEAAAQAKAASAATPGEKPVSGVKGAYNVQVKNYSWDQSEKFVKIYLTGIEGAKEEDVKKEITKTGVEVRVENVSGKNHVFTIKETCAGMNPEKSYVKVKSSMVVVFLAKDKVGENWSTLTMAESLAKKAKEPKIPPVDKNADPQVNKIKYLSLLLSIF